MTKEDDKNFENFTKCQICDNTSDMRHWIEVLHTEIVILMSVVNYITLTKIRII